MTLKKGRMPEQPAESPASKRLAELLKKLEVCLAQCRGIDSQWENDVSNKMVVLQVAIQTVENHEDLPDGMTINSLEQVIENLIKRKPQAR